MEFAERLVYETNLFTGGQEDEDLGLEVGTKEGKEDVKLLRKIADKVVLLEVPWGGAFVVDFLNTYLHGFVQTETSKVLDRISLSSGE